MFTYRKSLPIFCNPQIIINTRVSNPPNDLTSGKLKYHFLYIRMWSVLFWVFPSGDIQLHLGACFDEEAVRSRKIHFSIWQILLLLEPLSLFLSCKLSLPIIGSKTPSILIFVSKSLTRSVYGTSETKSGLAVIPRRNSPLSWL